MKKLTLLFTLASCLILVGNTSAQQQSLYTNYLFNQVYYNPAVVGSEGIHRANLNYRNQWVGFEGSPKTLSSSLTGSLKDHQKHGYGAMIVSDKLGLTARTGVYLNYAYQIKLNKTTRLGLGIAPGFVQYRVRLYDVRVIDGGDDLLTGNVLSANALDLNSGIYLSSEKYFVGLSASQLLGKPVTFTSYNDQLSMHYNLMGGYTFTAGKKFEVQPSTLLRYTPGAPFQGDFSLKGIFSKNFWTALSYRLDDAVSLGVGYTLMNRLSIGYSYDYALSSISPYQSGSHEIAISFVLTKKKVSLDEKDEELNNSIMEKNKKKRESEEQ